MTKTLLLSLVATTAILAQEGFEMLSDIKSNGQLLTRYESAEDNTNKDATAFTTRFMLGAGASVAKIEGLSTFGQLTSVYNYNHKQYAPEATGYATIVDPQNNRITQSYILNFRT